MSKTSLQDALGEMDCEVHKVLENFVKCCVCYQAKYSSFLGLSFPFFRTEQLEELFLRSSVAGKCGPAFFLSIL